MTAAAPGVAVGSDDVGELDAEPAAIDDGVGAEDVAEVGCAARRGCRDGVHADAAMAATLSTAIQDATRPAPF